MGESHAVHWFLDRDTVRGKLTCESPEGAPCRLVCLDDCETPTCDHEIVDGGSCNAVDWIENSGSLEEFYGGEDTRPLRDGLVVVRWDGDNWLWTYSGGESTVRKESDERPE